jgi:hypothetical protein
MPIFGGFKRHPNMAFNATKEPELKNPLKTIG